MGNSRVARTIKNAKISLIFYFLLLVITFFSRSVFIKYLGADYVGLTSTMMNIMGFLNLAEMGFSSVVAFALYKPLFDNDLASVGEVLSVFGYVYNRIGFIILICGAIIAVFLPGFFKGSGFSDEIIWATYFTYLTTTLLGFFVNYKEVLLAADQKNFIKVKTFNVVKIVKISTQILCLICVDYGVYGWLLLEFLFLSVYSIFINLQIKRLYPQLSSTARSGKALKDKYSFIYQKARQAFFHKFSSIVLQQTGGILIYMYSNLSMVTRYANYTLITSSIYTLLSSVFDSTNAAVGNLVAEKDDKKILSVFWELQVSRYWIATCMVYVTYSTIDLFISVWLGADYILSFDIKIILMLNLFVMLTRKTNDEFISACGLFKDVWAPIAEALLNISVAIVAGNLFGIVGIPLGMLLSTLLIIGIWKPVFLYREFIPEKKRYYFLRVFKYILVSLGSIFIAEKFPVLYLYSGNKYFDLLSLGLEKTFAIFTISWIVYYVVALEMRRFTKRFSTMIRNKLFA
ncbi:hypothetical protein A1353_16485 [Methylomonas methanica]|uniref:O-antigen/teichoic acid export membrane protein n=2 Tax=Methylomonas methanica TaxID=421 RepID=A0A177M9I0_METMH|nr:hypothetical protein A1353_16485 [Methylomonas methanica]